MKPLYLDPRPPYPPGPCCWSPSRPLESTGDPGLGSWSLHPNENSTF